MKKQIWYIIAAVVIIGIIIYFVRKKSGDRSSDNVTGTDTTNTSTNTITNTGTVSDNVEKFNPLCIKKCQFNFEVNSAKCVVVANKTQCLENATMALKDCVKNCNK